MNKKKTKSTLSYGELLKNFYGVASPNTMFDLNQFEGLIAQYYGRPHEEKKKNNEPASWSSASPALSLSFDNGEVLPQPAGSSQYQEYIVQSLADELAFEEYVVNADNLSVGSSMSMEEIALPMEEPRVEQEYLLDVLQPLKESPASPPVQGKTAPPPAANTTPAYEKLPQTPAPAEQPLQPAPVETSKATEADFMEDLQSILTGQKVFDPVSKKTVEKDQLGASQAGQAKSNESERPVSAQNEQAIFDRIAQSMQYANTFDLGSVELENRFADFDKIHELQENTKKKKSVDADASRGQAPAPATKSSSSDAKPPVDTADFLQDLDAIKQVKEPKTEAPGEAPSVAYATPQDYDDDYSRPMFDTGEHVLMGGDLYVDRLLVNGVAFSYGQIMAMADLYKSVEQMMRANAGELANLKKLIQRSAEYYKGGKTNKALDVSDDTWDLATSGRYLQLAEDNYEHFSPNLFFTGSPSSLPRNGDHYSAWKRHHRQAIEEAQKLGKSTKFLEKPLIINAFGDHYLTDAFAAGHQINKDEMSQLFKSNFYKGKELTSAGEEFFAKVAELAFKGEVRKKFSVLETYDSLGWWALWWNPNIDTVNAFRKLLVKGAEQDPNAVANVAVKALHDYFNKWGIDVTNNAGDKPWRIIGDGYSNPESRVVIRKAVQQSVDNINDPSIFGGKFSFDAAYAKVWKYVPQPTAASKERIRLHMQDYTNPRSAILQQAAADIISNKVDVIIRKLKRDKKLKDA